MASRDHQEGYAKHFGGRLSNFTEHSTEDDVRSVYDDWSSDYNKVRSLIGSLTGRCIFSNGIEQNLYMGGGGGGGGGGCSLPSKRKFSNVSVQKTSL